VRDYVHVTDVARTHVRALQYLALQYLEDGNDSLAVNLGSVKGTSIYQVLDAARRLTTRPVPIAVELR
jgi:UDP-glucose 4-epimerase